MKRLWLLFLFLNLGYGFCRGGPLEIQGEFLYFKPTYEQSYYVVSSKNNFFEGNLHPNGKRFSNHPFFDPGFRVQGIYSFCNWINELALRLTYFYSYHKDSKSGAFLFDTNGFPGNATQAPEDTSYEGKATAREHLQYISSDLAFSTEVFNWFPEKFFVFFGLHFASIRLKEHFASFGTSIDNNATLPVSNHLTRHSDFWGLGPEFGVDFRYFFPICHPIFSLVANGRIFLLGSHTETRFRYVTTRSGPSGLSFRNTPGLWRITPGADVKVGLNMSTFYTCFKMNWEIGYELIWVSDCLDMIYGTSVGFAGDSIDVFSNLSLQGPYAMISLTF